MLDEVDARTMVLPTFADLDIDALGLPPDRALGLSNFAFMGIVDSELRHKPAYVPWADWHGRPRER